MPNGVPVATVALNAAKNAGILAAQILGSSDEAIRAKMLDYMQELKDAVAVKYNRLDEMGYEGYVKE